MPDDHPDTPRDPFSPDLEEFESLRSPGRFLFWAVLAIAVLGILSWAIFPGYRMAKAVRARSVARQGEELLREGRLDEVAPKLRTALIFGPNDPEVLRFAARTLSALKSPQALTYWEMLVALPKATQSDRLDYVKSTLAEGRLDRARAMLEKLYDSSPKDPSVLGLGIEYFRATGNHGKAIEASRQLLDLHSTNMALRVVAAQVLLQSTNMNEIGRARGLLGELGKDPGNLGEAALSALAGDPNLPDDEANTTLVKLTNRPSLDPRVALITAELWSRLAPAQTNEADVWLEKALGKSPPAGEEILELAAWSLRQGKSDRLLAWIPEDRSRTNANWLLVRAEALSHQQRWAEVDRLVANTNNILNPFQRSIFQTLNLWAQGNAKEAHRELAALVDDARGHPERLIALASAAENAEAWAAAVEAWRELSHFPAMQLTGGIHAMKAARRLGDARTIIDIYREFANAVPGDYGVRVDIIYFRLLVGDPAGDVRREYDALPAAIRQSDLGQVLAAMLAMREGNYSEALTRIETPHFDWTKTERRWQLLFAAALAANRQREAARTLIRQLDPNDFMPVERQFANIWLPTRF